MVLQYIPPPSQRRIALRVTPEAQRALRQGHPWLFDQAIAQQSHAGAPGDLAVVFDDYRRFLAIGLYDPASPLRVRILQHGEPAAIDDAWLAERITAAAARRAALPATGTTGYRLIHGENDGLPGLVVDRYEDTLVLKLYTAAWVPWLSRLLPALAAVQPAGRVVLRLSRELLNRPEHLYGLEEGLLTGAGFDGSPGLVQFSENGLRFEADVLRGQKTGFFLDQRDNRARVERLAAGRRVLNVFAYTGGFSLYAARGGAREILSVDLSVPALEAARRNFDLNRHIPAVAAARHITQAGDAFDALAALREQGERYELVIVDPPAFAKRASEVEAALRAYARLTVLALGVTRPGGLLVSASCSSRVSADDFYSTVKRTAEAAGRPLREVEHTGHALDHPISFPEGAYLKCLYAVAP